MLQPSRSSAIALLAILNIAVLGCGHAPSTPAAITTSQPTASPVKPPALPLPAFGYDPSSAALIVVAGVSRSDADVWLWTPRGWTEKRTVETPQYFNGSSMAYDESAQTMVMVVPPGVGTWLHDQSGWQRLAVQPSLLAEPETVYDPKEKAVIAIALSAAVAGPHPVPILPLEQDDRYWGVSLWTWDGAAWHESRTPLFRRIRPALAYDAARGRLVVFGGPDPQDPLLPVDPTTFLWDGARWTYVTAEPHPPTRQPTAVYDPIRHEVIVFSEGETWAWDGIIWSRRASDGPGAREDVRMAFDAAIGQVVLFGGRSPGAFQGHSDLNDLWGWDGSTWHQLA